MGLTMPKTDKLEEGIRSVGKACPGVRILVFTVDTTEYFIRKALEAGAHGYVLKSDPESDLLSAVEHLMHNRVFYTSEVLKPMTRSFLASKSPGMPHHGLTEREVEVVALLANGNSNKQASVKLNVSMRTVEAHRKKAMSKLKFSSFSELVRFAIRQGMILP